jgi:glycosyltransferase involved in cell wall biosynthesis
VNAIQDDLDHGVDYVPAVPSDGLVHAKRMGKASQVAGIPRRLTIVIPALNEQESIGSTIQRCLDAREEIQEVGGVQSVEIIAVSDGSTDRTVEIATEIASREADVRVIVFEKNRGYGAAIKEGFRQGRGDLVGFLDADGTCDPRYFGPMCRSALQDRAAIVLGSRMGAGSRMPAIRRVGNRLYATLLGLLSGKAVEDTASGMRILDREALDVLYPLPDGLHFTPAMSARALLLDLKVIEVPMSYAERQGRSKLSVVRDGVRFLASILNALLLFRPGRMFAAAGLLLFAIALMWGLYPAEFYLRNRRLEEWMIYRVLLCAFAITCGCNLLVAGSLCDRLLELVFPASRRLRTFFSQTLESLLRPLTLLCGMGVMMVVAIGLISPGLWQYATSGQVTIHWSRVVLASLLLQLCLLAIVSVIQQRILALWNAELKADRR